MATETGLDARIDELARIPGLHGLVVVQNGGLAAQWYGTGEDFSWGDPLGTVTFGPDVLHDIRSVTKSVVSLVYGIALADGLVPAPAEPLLRQFPEYPDLAEDPARAKLTVEHALTMTMGLEWNEDAPYTSLENSEIAMEHAEDRHRYVLGRPVVEEPGQRWSYCGGASALVGRLIVKGVGQTLPEYARWVLFEPLGISAFGWAAGHDGVASAASGLRLTPPDLARIGRLALGRGRWQGRRIVPEDWIVTALRRHVPIEEDWGYGYQWWLGTFPAAGGTGPVSWAAGNGNGGQRLFVVSSLDLVVAITCGNYDAQGQSATPTVVMTEAVLPALAG
jgi:CubicO group peptidase (beta-lactamase class C family)